MRKIIATIIMMLLLVGSVFCIDIRYTGSDELEYHNHDAYEVWFDLATKNPAYVVWSLTEEDAILASQSSNRKSWSFVACKSAKSASRNYPKTGFDQGHMCPAEDEDQTTARSKNTFRACNICPQTSALNRGIWSQYEKKERSLAQKYQDIRIVCGPIYYADAAPVYIGKDNLRVPDEFFKVFYYDGHFEAYIFGQDNSVRESTLDEIKDLTDIEIGE